MQLVEIAITGKGPWPNPSIEKKNNFLILRADNIEIKYFVRKDKKYYLPDKNFSNQFDNQLSLTFTEKDVENYLSKNNKANDFYTNKALSKLNGSNSLQVPSIMMIDLLFDISNFLAPEFHLLKIKFYEQILQDDILDVFYTKKKDYLEILVRQKNVPTLWVEVLS